MRLLQDVLRDFGLDTSDWRLTQAIGVLADGNTIVGNMVEANGSASSVFVATIPAPSTGLLLGVGLAMVAVTRKRKAPEAPMQSRGRSIVQRRTD